MAVTHDSDGTRDSTCLLRPCKKKRASKASIKALQKVAQLEKVIAEQKLQIEALSALQQIQIVAPIAKVSIKEVQIDVPMLQQQCGPLSAPIIDIKSVPTLPIIPQSKSSKRPVQQPLYNDYMALKLSNNELMLMLDKDFPVTTIEIALQKSEFVKEVNKGTEGTLYMYLHKKKQYYYIVKELNISGDKYSRMQAVVNEFNMIKPIRHPNLIRYRKLFRTATSMCITMECVNGINMTQIHKHIPKNCILNRENLYLYLYHSAQGIKALHDAGIAHRDIKPENFMQVVTTQGDLYYKLVDYGYVTSIGNVQADLHDVGSPLYKAPEIVWQCGLPKKKGDVSKCDIWPYGITLLHLFRGGHAFNLTPDGDKFSYSYTQYEKHCTKIMKTWRDECDKSQYSLPMVVYKIIEMCLQTDQTKRATITQISDMLTQYATIKLTTMTLYNIKSKETKVIPYEQLSILAESAITRSSDALYAEEMKLRDLMIDHPSQLQHLPQEQYDLALDVAFKGMLELAAYILHLLDTTDKRTTLSYFLFKLEYVQDYDLNEGDDIDQKLYESLLFLQEIVPSWIKLSSWDLTRDITVDTSISFAEVTHMLKLCIVDQVKYSGDELKKAHFPVIVNGQEHQLTQDSICQHWCSQLQQVQVDFRGIAPEVKDKVLVKLDSLNLSWAQMQTAKEEITSQIQQHYIDENITAQNLQNELLCELVTTKSIVDLIIFKGVTRMNSDDLQEHFKRKNNKFVVQPCVNFIHHLINQLDCDTLFYKPISDTVIEMYLASDGIGVLKQERLRPGKEWTRRGWHEDSKNWRWEHKYCGLVTINPQNHFVCDYDRKQRKVQQPTQKRTKKGTVTTAPLEIEVDVSSTVAQLHDSAVLAATPEVNNNRTTEEISVFTNSTPSQLCSLGQMIPDIKIKDTMIQPDFEPAINDFVSIITPEKIEKDEDQLNLALETPDDEKRQIVSTAALIDVATSYGNDLTNTFFTQHTPQMKIQDAFSVDSLANAVKSAFNTEEVKVDPTLSDDDDEVAKVTPLKQFITSLTPQKDEVIELSDDEDEAAALIVELVDPLKERFYIDLLNTDARGYLFDPVKEICDNCVEWFRKMLNHMNSNDGFKHCHFFSFYYFKRDGEVPTDFFIRRRFMQNKGYEKYAWPILSGEGKNAHWTLVVMDTKTARLAVYNSSWDCRIKEPQVAQLWAVSKHMFLQGGLTQHDCPQQTNVYDCGAYVMTNMQLLRHGKKIDSKSYVAGPNVRQHVTNILQKIPYIQQPLSQP